MPLTLFVDCPCTSFPRSFARDYKETYRLPPPVTVYGMLLSLIGETDVQRHRGAQFRIGMLSEPMVSRILRKQRQHKFSKHHQGSYSAAQFSSPNFQEILTGLKFVVEVDETEEASPSLAERLARALDEPHTVNRFGALSLGESSYIVNGIRRYRTQDGKPRWLEKSQSHDAISLPVWIDRVSGRGTFERFSITEPNAAP